MISWFESRVKQRLANAKMAKNARSPCKIFQVSLSEIRSEWLQPINEYNPKTHEELSKIKGG